MIFKLCLSCDFKSNLIDLFNEIVELINSKGPALGAYFVKVAKFLTFLKELVFHFFQLILSRLL